MDRLRKVVTSLSNSQISPLAVITSILPNSEDFYWASIRYQIRSQTSMGVEVTLRIFILFLIQNLHQSSLNITWRCNACRFFSSIFQPACGQSQEWVPRILQFYQKNWVPVLQSKKKHTDVFWENTFTYFFMNVLFLYVCQQLIYCIKGIRLKQLLFSTWHVSHFR